MAPNTDIATRALVVALKSPIGGKTTPQISAFTGLPAYQVNRIYARACQRGFDPNQIPLVIKDEWLEDAPRTGRPTKQTPTNIDLILSKVRRDRYGREKTVADLAGDLSQLGIDISASTVHRILRKAGFRKTKPTRKPGLTKKMKEDRLRWCLEHKDWTLEDWKNVIWSDETSVVLNHRRGGYRVWRKSDEAFVRSCIRERWKGYSEFMFWACFSYDKKGPCHCWLPELAAEKRQSLVEIEALNQELEPLLREEWELNIQTSRLSLRGKPGPKPTWKFTQATGKLQRGKGSGIDWYRYQKVILVPKLFPFVRQCLEDRPDTVVQEDKAPAHAHWYQHRVYNIHKIIRLLWPVNAPDLNPIELAWPFLKRKTTAKGAPKSRAEGIKAWEKAWKDLPQSTLQRFVERLQVHVAKVIELEGSNEYREGRGIRRERRAD